MESRPSQHPRDVIARAAMHDAATLAGILANQFVTTYAGPDRRAYLDALGGWLADLGAVIEDGPDGSTVRIEGRRITIRFGPLSGHR